MVRQAAEAIVEDANERFGVGIYFGQDEEEQIFVQSLAPQGSAFRARTVQEGDVLVKVDNKFTSGMSLVQLKSLVVGAQGSAVTLAFRRHTLKSNFFYYDVELMRGGTMYLDLLQRNLQLAEEKDRLSHLLAEHQARVDALRAERDGLRNNPLVQDDPRVLQLQEELRASQLETNNLKLQRNSANERSLTLRSQVDVLEATVTEQASKIRELSTLSKDRLSYVTEMERRRGEEKGMWRAVHQKLEGDLKEGEVAKRDAQYSLVQALADLQHARQDATLLQALKLNHDVGLDLATLVAESETTHNNVIAGIKRNTGPTEPFYPGQNAWPPAGVEPVRRKPLAAEGAGEVSA